MKKLSRLRFVAMLCWGLLSFAADVGAAVLYVDAQNGGCGGSSPCFALIQDAVTAADSGDEILVRPGIYTENLQVSGKRLALKGLSGPRSTILDGGAVKSVVSVFEGAHLSIEGFTIQNGGGEQFLLDNGYGIVVAPFDEASLTVRNCIVRRNHSRGGIGLVGGSDVRVEVRDSFLSENSKGIAVDTFGDSIERGGVVIVNNVIAFNGGSGDPGAPSGGGMLLLGCCPFGPPLEFRVDVLNNTVYGNVALYGGGLAANISNLTLRNNVFFANSAAVEGADLYLVQAALDAIVSFNLIGSGVLDGVDGNHSANPVFFDPERLDFALLPGSPAIDAGSNEAAPAADLEGKPRPADGNLDGVATVDQGALEFRAPTRLEICEASEIFDSDGDGEFDPTDACPDSSPLAIVDDSGCSLEQFCESVPTSGPIGWIRCSTSDWQNDEALLRLPRDCEQRRGQCVARDGPKVMSRERRP